MAQYLPVLVMLRAGDGRSPWCSLLASSKLLAPRLRTRPRRRRTSAASCPSREPPERFPVRFYLVAMLFIMFDIEIMFLYPYAVIVRASSVRSASSRWCCSALVFFLSFVYEVAKGGARLGSAARGSRRLAAGVSAERTTPTTIRRVGLEGRGERGGVSGLGRP